MACKPPKVALFIESSRRYGHDLLRGIIQYSRENGPWVFYREPVWGEDILSRLRNWGVTGVMALVGDQSKADMLISLGVPLLITGKVSHERYRGPHILGDSQAIARMAADYFQARGFRHFAFCGHESWSPDENQWSVARGEALRDELAQKGHEVAIFQYPRPLAKLTLEKELDTLAAWISSLPKPLALLTSNDDRAQSLFDACRLARQRVPDDVAILGIDNDELVCDLTDPPLSSICLNMQKGGYEAAALLDAAMKGQKMSSELIALQPTHVVSRRSTDLLAVEDPMLVHALQYIRDHADQSLTVGGIAEAVSTSRRTLERKFSHELKRSVLSEIKRVRAEQVTVLLVQTSWSISRIAQHLHFPTCSHMARFFRQEKGCTPGDYRRQCQKGTKGVRSNSVRPGICDEE